MKPIFFIILLFYTTFSCAMEEQKKEHPLYGVLDTIALNGTADASHNERQSILFDRQRAQFPGLFSEDEFDEIDIESQAPLCRSTACYKKTFVGCTAATAIVAIVWGISYLAS